MTPSTDRTLSQIISILQNMIFHLITRGFNRTFATDVACVKGTRIPPDNLSSTICDLYILYLVRAISFSRSLEFCSWSTSFWKPQYPIAWQLRRRLKTVKDFSNKYICNIHSIGVDIRCICSFSFNQKYIHKEHLRDNMYIHETKKLDYDRETTNDNRISVWYYLFNLKKYTDMHYQIALKECSAFQQTLTQLKYCSRRAHLYSNWKTFKVIWIDDLNMCHLDHFNNSNLMSIIEKPIIFCNTNCNRNDMFLRILKIHFYPIRHGITIEIKMFDGK